MNNPNMKHHGLDMLIWSHDDGLTWTDKDVLSFPPEKNLGSMIGPSIGIQASDGTIYFSVIDVAGSGHFLYFSKDIGKTWRASKAVPSLGECSIAFLISASDGRIIMNCRIKAGLRAHVIWSKDAVPGKVTHPPELNVDPGCQGSIINQGGTLYTSNANSTHSRSHMAIKISKTQGKTWDGGVPVCSGPSAYSQLVSLGDDSTVGVLFEAGSTGKILMAYETISFAVVKVN